MFGHILQAAEASQVAYIPLSASNFCEENFHAFPMHRKSEFGTAKSLVSIVSSAKYYLILQDTCLNHPKPSRQLLLEWKDCLIVTSTNDTPITVLVTFSTMCSCRINASSSSTHVFAGPVHSAETLQGFSEEILIVVEQISNRACQTSTDCTLIAALVWHYLCDIERSPA